VARDVSRLGAVPGRTERIVRESLVVRTTVRHGELLAMIVLKLLGNLLLFLIPAAPFAMGASFLMKTSRDEWRLLVWLPVLPLAIWGVIVAVAVTRDPTSHNLWPFEAVIWGTLSVILQGLVYVGRWAAARAETARQSSHVHRRPPTAP
jgi:hypothetical protein